MRLHDDYIWNRKIIQEKIGHSAGIMCVHVCSYACTHRSKLNSYIKCIVFFFFTSLHNDKPGKNFNYAKYL